MMESEVSIRIATLAEKPMLAGMAQFYIYDFSDMHPVPPDDFDFEADGTFGPMPHFDEYWSEPDRVALIILVGSKPAGFALLNTHSHFGGTVEHNMGEFYVARKFRRSGIAGEALCQILKAYPGHWEFAVMARNHAAQAFWPRALASASNVSGLTRKEGDGIHWTGPIWSCDAV
ncbi:MAG: GNAT family N-acetyltransferase [Parvibaculum sp.]|nr:GNAT family N-acetyltransferase [Parvibaculum sp.]